MINEQTKPIIEHVGELRNRFIRIMISILVCTFALFALSTRNITIDGRNFLIPYPNIYNNIASQIITILQEIVLPEYVRVILTTPGQALSAQIYVSASNATPYLYKNSIVIGIITNSANTAPIKNKNEDGASKFLSNFISLLYNPGFTNPIISQSIRGIEITIPHMIETYICADNACPGVVKITLTYSGRTIS